MIRTANIEVSLQRLSILRIEHPQANPLRLACTLRAGETLPSGLTVTAEIHTSRNVAAETTPLASSTVTVVPGATSFEVSFTSAQLNQTVTPDSVRALWLVVYGVADDDTVYTLSAADLLLGWHAISQLTAAPPNVTLFVEKGGVVWAAGRDYQSGTMVTAGATAYVATAGHTSGASTEPGEGASWETVWTVLSGGGGGATNLGITSTATAVTITNDNGDGVEIPEASETDAGVMSAELRNKLVDLPTADTLGALATRDTVGTSQIDNDSVGELQIANNAVTSAKIAANAVTYAKMQAVSAASRLIGRGTAGTTAVREISLGSGLSMSGDVLSATASGDVVGPSSSVDNAVARFDLTTGKLIQGSSIVIDDETASTQQNVAIRNVDPATNSAVVITPKGTGAFILGPKPDGTSAGGGARGSGAVDLQTLRSGINQTASGARAALLGGSVNTASGSESIVLGGNNNSASQDNSAVIGGNNNSASGQRAACIGGNNNSASGGQAIAMGTFNTASAISTLATGQSAVANRFGMRTHAAGSFSSLGDAQSGTLVARNQTSSATQADLFLNGSSDRVTLLNNQSIMADVFVAARSATGADDACFHRRCLITRDANAASTAIVGSVQTIGTDIETAGATAWDVTLAADTTNGALRILVTGAASTNINWVAKISTVEVIRA
jgi:hypothetical protein